MKRVLLKLSGEALAGEKHTGFDEATVVKVAKQVKQTFPLSVFNQSVGKYLHDRFSQVGCQ